MHKEGKTLKAEPMSPPQANVFNPECNELNYRFVGNRFADRQWYCHSAYGTKLMLRMSKPKPKPTRNNRQASSRRLH